MPRIVHFEIPADNMDRAEKFYKGVFGWKVQKWDNPQMDYRLCTTGDEKELGINGAIMTRGQYSCVIDTIDVPDVDAYAKKITAGGGKIVVPKMSVPGQGYVAYFLDTEGNTLGIFHTDMSAK